MPLARQSPYRPPSLVLSYQSYESYGGSSRLLSTTAAASAAWGTANLGIIIPFTLTAPTLYVVGYFYNGATSSGNLDVGIYDEAFALIVSTGAIAQGSVNVLQSLAMTDTTLQPGNYYIGASCSSATATVFSQVTTGARGAAAGFAQMASAHPLPNPFVPALYAQTLSPCFGLAQKTWNI